MKTFGLFTVAALASYATAAAVDAFKRDTPLKVELSAAGNSLVKVVLTNNGNETLNLLNKGTFLDEDYPLEKVTIYANKGTTKVPFEGITSVYFLTSDLRSEDFLTLAAGAKKVFSVETAALHTLDDGGDFDVFAQGALPFANANSTELTGSLDYESNKLNMKINGTEAATVTKAIAKRSTVDTNCNRHQRKAIRTALSNCQRLASSAATAAAAGTKLSTYFNSTTPSTRHAVYARLHSIASECGNLGSVASINCDVSSE